VAIETRTARLRLAAAEGAAGAQSRQPERCDCPGENAPLQHDIVHAIGYALVIEDAGEDPDRWLLIGPDTAGNLLEVVALITADRTQIAIHAMPMRDRYAKLLEP
jgi:hypothetical protein